MKNREFSAEDRFNGAKEIDEMLQHSPAFLVNLNAKRGEAFTQNRFAELCEEYKPLAIAIQEVGDPNELQAYLEDHNLPYKLGNSSGSEAILKKVGVSGGSGGWIELHVGAFPFAVAARLGVSEDVLGEHYRPTVLSYTDISYSRILEDTLEKVNLFTLATTHMPIPTIPFARRKAYRGFEAAIGSDTERVHRLIDAERLVIMGDMNHARPHARDKKFAGRLGLKHLEFEADTYIAQTGDRKQRIADAAL